MTHLKRWVCATFLTLTACVPAWAQLSVGISNPGTFTNTQMNEYVDSILNNCSPSNEYHAVQGQFGTDGLTGCIAIPSGATTYSTNAVAGFVNNSSKASNAVGGYFQARCLVNSSRCLGANPVVMDGTGITSGEYMTGIEIDAQPQNVASAYSVLSGIQLTLFAPNAGNYGTGIVIGSGQTGTWGTGILCNNGQLAGCLLVGKYTGAAGGTTLSGSQGIQFVANNGSGDITASGYEDSLGDLVLTPASGAVTLLIGGTRQGSSGSNVTLHQHTRIATGPIGANSRAEVLLTWPNTFSNSSYTVNCNVEDSTSAAGTQGLAFERLRTKSATQVGAVVYNPTGASLLGALDCIADHD